MPNVESMEGFEWNVTQGEWIKNGIIEGEIVIRGTMFTNNNKTVGHNV